MIADTLTKASNVESLNRLRGKCFMVHYSPSWGGCWNSPWLVTSLDNQRILCALFLALTIVRRNLRSNSQTQSHRFKPTQANSYCASRSLSRSSSTSQLKSSDSRINSSVRRSSLRLSSLKIKTQDSSSSSSTSLRLALARTAFLASQLGEKCASHFPNPPLISFLLNQLTLSIFSLVIVFRSLRTLFLSFILCPFPSIRVCSFFLLVPLPFGPHN